LLVLNNMDVMLTVPVGSFASPASKTPEGDLYLAAKLV
jgi:hypothetical protein